MKKITIFYYNLKVFQPVKLLKKTCRKLNYNINNRNTDLNTFFKNYHIFKNTNKYHE